MQILKENKNLLIIIFVLLWIFISIFTFFLYKIDKKKARKHQWRIKEATLLLFPWLFGSIGGIMGMYLLRHKTKHWYFVINNIIAIIIHIVCFIFLLCI